MSLTEEKSNNISFTLEDKIHRDSTVMSHYHYHIYPNLGEGRSLLQHIPWTCVACIDQPDQAWII